MGLSSRLRFTQDLIHAILAFTAFERQKQTATTYDATNMSTKTTILISLFFILCIPLWIHVLKIEEETAPVRFDSAVFKNPKALNKPFSIRMAMARYLREKAVLSGLSKDQVRGLLGTPLSALECGQYCIKSPPGGLKYEVLGFPVTEDQTMFRWSLVVYFDEDKVVKVEVRRI